MTGLSRRRFLEGAGAVGLTAVAGCLGGETDGNEAGPLSPAAIDPTFSDVLDENAYYQEQRLEELNAMNEEDGIDPVYDPATVDNDVYPAGTFHNEGFLGPEGEYDVKMSVETAPDTVYDDLEEYGEFHGERQRDMAVSAGMALMIDPHLYIPVRGRQGTEHYDPDAYSTFEEMLSGMECRIEDQEGNTVSLTVPPEDVERLRASVEEKEKGESFREIRTYAREGLEYDFG